VASGALGAFRFFAFKAVPVAEVLLNPICARYSSFRWIFCNRNRSYSEQPTGSLESILRSTFEPVDGSDFASTAIGILGPGRFQKRHDKKDPRSHIEDPTAPRFGIHL
jgi:hypothetical protein